MAWNASLSLKQGWQQEFAALAWACWLMCHLQKTKSCNMLWAGDHADTLISFWRSNFYVHSHNWHMLSKVGLVTCNLRICPAMTTLRTTFQVEFGGTLHVSFGAESCLRNVCTGTSCVEQRQIHCNLHTDSFVFWVLHIESHGSCVLLTHVLCWLSSAVWPMANQWLMTPSGCDLTWAKSIDESISSSTSPTTALHITIRLSTLYLLISRILLALYQKQTRTYMLSPLITYKPRANFSTPACSRGSLSRHQQE